MTGSMQLKAKIFKQLYFYIKIFIYKWIILLLMWVSLQNIWDQNKKH